tara:strand:- start:694 stop:1410 length:717 start_codon:yes stop_codon:yes gene_type:complete
MHKPRKLIDIVIPFNNEFENLEILLPKILKTIRKIKFFKFRLVLIDDGSTDNGNTVVFKYKKKNKNIFLIKNKIKMGQTYSYKMYLKKFTSKYFIRMDADNQDDPIYLIKISKYIKKNFQMILTERKLRKHSTYMIILTFLYNMLISFLVKKKLKNYSSSLVFYQRKFINYKNLKINDHRYLPIIAIENGAKKIKIIPVMHKKRIFGRTKYKILKKIIFALPEFLLFFYRLRKGYYKI